MENIRRFETISDYNAFNSHETLHPLVSVFDLSKANPRHASTVYFGFYTVFLKEGKCGDLRYGKNTYDCQEGTLVFIAPGQVITGDNVNQGILERFEILLNEHFVSDKPQTLGLPSITYCSSELNLSAGYFGDLVKKETGKTAQGVYTIKGN